VDEATEFRARTMPPLSKEFRSSACLSAFTLNNVKYVTDVGMYEASSRVT